MKAVFVAHRHGARFMSAPQVGNNSSPQNEDFWKLHSMQLTPQGSNQLEDLGKQLAIAYPEMLDRVEVFSSNTTRTVGSAMALLDGLVPGHAHHIECGYKNPVYVPNSITIHVEKNKQFDSLFHLGKKTNAKWRKQNIKESKIIDGLETEENVSLLDKLFTMSNCSSIDPCKSFTDRVSSITMFVNLVRYGMVHSSHILPNALGIKLSAKELERIIELGNVVYSHYFTPSNGVKTKDTGSSCFMLLDEICRRMTASETKGFYIYSAHDTTLLALSAAFGLIVPCPDFASYFIFELFHDGIVNVKVNMRPREIRLNELNRIWWSSENSFLELEAVEEGSFTVQDFIDRFSHKCYPKLLDIISKKCDMPIDPIVFTYFERGGTWNDDSLREISYRFGQTI